MPELYESDMPFLQSLREGPTSALEHIRSLWQSRKPGPIFEEEIMTCTRDLLMLFLSASKEADDPNVIALAMSRELRRACFDSEILLLFADMMADGHFLKHTSVGYSL